VAVGYGDAVEVYVRAGWGECVLPLPPRAKEPPPQGFTGWWGEPVTKRSRSGWKLTYPDGNLCLHLPPGVFGWDLDAYGDKHGDRTTARLEATFGPLPVTWMSTARPPRAGDRYASGIRYFTVPLDLVPPGGFPGVETIHTCYRYAVVWGSTHPDLGVPYYYYYGPPWRLRVGVPRPEELPALPEAWVEFLRSRRGSGASTGGHPHARDADVEGFYAAHTTASHPYLIESVLAHAQARVDAGYARHDTYCRAAVQAACEAAAGFYPASVLERVRDALYDAIGADREVEAEWARIESWAVLRAEASDHDELRADVLDRIEPGHGWAPGLTPSSPSWTPEGASTWQPPSA
jgi:hypothetical protein